MEHIADLPAKLGLLQKAMSLSRVGLAHRMGVDKSLVGRWFAGKVYPSEHSLSRLSAIVAESIPGFRLADLFGDAGDLASRLGVELADGAPADAGSGQTPLTSFLEFVRPEIARRAGAYEGFWRTSRPSLVMPGQLFHDFAMIRKGADGLLEIVIQGSGLDFAGWAFPAAGNLFIFLFDSTGRTPVSLLFRGVSLPKATVLDGILTLAALDSNRTPVALPIIAERVGDLTGDEAGDEERLDEYLENSVETLPLLSKAELEARLHRDTGPAAAAAGKELFVMVSAVHSLSRGSAGPGLQG